jgi:signal transduction histidine kinase
VNKLHPDSRLLIVDESRSSICLLQNILNRFGFRNIESITEPQEALSRMERFRPDLLILDPEMRDEDGFAVMRELTKWIPRGTILPILVLTANGTTEVRRKALAAGAADFLAKPFDSAEVFMRIRNLLHIRMLHRELQGQNMTLESKVEERTRELRQTQRQIIAQERLHAFSEMAGGVVHDFNNALMSVIGYSDILLQDEETLLDVEQARKFLTIINTAGQDAALVVGRLRNFYRPREVSDVFSAIDLNEIIGQAVPITKPKWKDHALEGGRVIEVELDLAKVPPVLGNSFEIREVLTNLIFNAVDAMPQGGTIRLRSSWENNRVIIEVTDTGTGMTEEVRNRCLEPFFSTKGENGTGLGLSTVLGIIKRHEGTVEIASEPGFGTTFRISLPGLVEVVRDQDEETPKLDRSLHVLLVDDEPVSRHVLQKLLSADGHTVVTATNGTEATACNAAERFDLMITDHGMPDMNGVQLAAAVRERHAGHPVILVTGFSEVGGWPQEKLPEIDLVLRKPVARGALRKALHAVMDGRAVAPSDAAPQPADEEEIPSAAGAR